MAVDYWREYFRSPSPKHDFAVIWDADADRSMFLDEKGEFISGAYVTALLYQPMDETQKRMPSRAIGIKWLPVDQSARRLKVGGE